ncbi:S46 family peptidase [Aureliella helgolandensis]|uniref:Peptidase S46 n=1 Tax=Aureliella helgolandensis TaxID=2527968 RepID=A0A518G0F7_9BACT|nr:S46 family peptidase [Aureliella helgolandensis]QDV22085.1 Peptidase S46 [Aureliella helgolandensis]
MNYSYVSFIQCRLACLCLAFTAVCCSVQNASAEEGMYPMSELKQLDLPSRGIELTAEQLFNPQAISLVDGVCRVNGCTGSFVSPTGLIITNHHCAYGAIQQASQGSHDYLSSGFKADSLSDEIPAPDYTVRVTQDYRDISAEVLAVVQPGMSYLERSEAIEKKSKEIELAAEQANPGLRAEVAEMFAGKTYVLFQYVYLRDIRLVFAPPQSVGNFGGEVDNWMWPRHTGDFSFMRAYTAPDGSSASYSVDNIPYQPKRFVQVSVEGVQEEDAVFLLGYPGRTARHKTAAFLNYEEHVRLPTLIELYNWQIEVMTAAGEGDREVEIKHASRMRSLSNVEKRSRGQLQGLRRAHLAEKRRATEAELQAFIESDSARKAKYGELLKEIQAVYQEMEQLAPLEFNLQQLRSASRAAAIAYFIVDAASERQKPDLDRESAYMERNWEQSLQSLKSSVNDYHAATDEILLAGMMERLKAVEAGPVTEALKRQFAASIVPMESVQQWLARTSVGEWEFVERYAAQTPQTLAQTDDPILQLMLELYPTYLELRDREKTREGRLSELYGSLIEIKQQFAKSDFVPDANATLRFTCGHVRRYSPADAVVMLPLTTLSGVIDKTTGKAPFDTPSEVVEKFEADELGRYRNATLNDVPVAILYDTDTTGGNSGSPIFNAKGELVGVNFDRCFEATINDFAWDQSYSRSIGVDIRYVLWLTDVVYGAERLIEEMGVKH